MSKGNKFELKKNDKSKFKLQYYDRKSKQLQSISDKLQKENDEMEHRIVALKEMMQKEREERQRLGGSRWKSSMVTSDAKPISMEKRTNKSKSQPKFKVLSDKPLENYTKKTIMNKSNEPKFSSCGQCEVAEAKLECIECGETYCPPCYKQFHAKGAMRKHTWRTLDQERPSSSKDRSYSRQKKRSGSSSTTNQAAAEYEDDPVDESQPGGLLLMGTYDEKESAASFQQALKEWRNGTSTEAAQRHDLWVNPVNQPQEEKETKSCATEAESSSQLPFDFKLNFNPEMSYADRLLLKKHRKDPQTKNGYVEQRNTKIKVPKNQSKQQDRAMSQQSKFSPNLAVKKHSPTPTDNGSPPQQQQLEYPSAVCIQLLSSDEDDNKYAASDLVEDSPIVNEIVDDAPRTRSDRRTLSQMGRLAIVELSFSDPENDTKVDTSRITSAASAVSSMSIRQGKSESKNTSDDRPVSKQSIVPHPPATPLSTYVTRQKLLMKKNKKNNKQNSTAAVKKSMKVEDKKWKPPVKYTGLDSFFMAGVEKENNQNTTIKNAEVNDSDTVKSSSDVTIYPTITVGTDDCWRPESSLSYTGESGVSKVRGTNSSEKPTKNTKALSITITDNAKKIDKKSKAQSNSLNASNGAKEKLSLSSNTSPRVSMTDFDFLSAMPPMSKGDDFNKIHRASTVTLFALSPQPPDVWNDDSEYELLNSPKVSKSPVDKLVVNESDEEDKRALEALSTEMTNKNDSMERRANEEGDNWQEDSLSIEDNDDGSGLTSSGDADTHNDSSDDDDYYDMKRQVKNLK